MEQYSIYEKGNPEHIYILISLEQAQTEQLYKLLSTQISDFSLVSFPVANWNAELSPWAASDARGGSFGGKGMDSLHRLQAELLPYLQEKYPNSKLFLVGYSLAGLFSLWSLYESDAFSGCACCSGSLWLDGWDSYVQCHTLRRQSLVYLSLGGKEEKTRNAEMACVGDRTRNQKKIIERDKNALSATLEWNPGGHFSDVENRQQKGILWLHSQKGRME